MAHDDLDHQLRHMLDDIPPHDDRARRATIAALSATPQRRSRWLPAFSLGMRRRSTSAQASLAAGAIVVVIGTLLFASSTKDATPGGRDPGDTPPEVISGSIVCGAEVHAPSVTGSGIELGKTGRQVVESRDASYRLPIVSMTDPRLTGTLTNRIDTDLYGVGPESLQIGALTWTLENNDGSWISRFVSFGTDPTDWTTATQLWHGGGDYEGLVAVTQLEYRPPSAGSECGWDLTGYIVPSSLLPDTPEAIP